MALPRAEAIFDGRRCRLFDLSVTGALVQLDFVPTVGAVLTLQLEAGAETLRLNARVVRVKPAQVTANPSVASPQWATGIAFVDVSVPNQRAIARFYTLILEESKRRPR